MNIEEIKAEILKLPDSEIGPLSNWLREYYDGDVWDRQIVADIERLGEEEFRRRLTEDQEQTTSEPRKAALRLMNSMIFKTDADREQISSDLAIVLGEGLEYEE